MKVENESVLKKSQDAPFGYGGHIDIVIIHALLESLFSVFSTMMRVEVVPGVPLPKEGTTAKGEVSGLLGMKAEGASGSVALSLTQPAIREISRNFFGYEIGCIDKEAADLTGELTNILVGGAKRILSERGLDFDMQTPQLLMGAGHKIVHHCDGQTVLLPVRVRQNKFYLELNFV